jgi:catechol 2,3-dioxygenase-like lactoylglutathione lyase family enzyme
MLDHIDIKVADYARTKAFYEEVMSSLGAHLVMEFGPEVTGGVRVAGLGREKPDFWISEGGPTSPRVHVAFAADSRAMVDAFHAAALAAGGRDNGAPGLRPEYHENYYGAFALDPDGHNVEAVCHRPE